jgi:hypothetical protein
VVAQKILVRVHVGVDGRGVRCGSVAHPIGELRPCARVLPHGQCCCVSGRVPPAPWRVWPGAAPCALSARIGLSAYGAEASRCSQHSPEWVLECLSLVWQSSGLARWTTTDEARRVW